MLRITLQNIDNATTIVLEGRLIRDWIPELTETWLGLAAAARPITLDLSSVYSIDPFGRRLLTEMHQRGVQLTGSGLMIRGLIEDITSR